MNSLVLVIAFIGGFVVGVMITSKKAVDDVAAIQRQCEIESRCKEVWRGAYKGVQKIRFELEEENRQLKKNYENRNVG